jgi:lysophospholipase-2
MPGWFDLYDWPIEVGATDDPKNKMEGVDKIMDAIDELVAQGIDKRKIVVGGFSQGGAIALLAAYHPYSRHQGLAGCAALSAWLTLTKDLEITETQKNTPLFWGHGQYDDKVLFEHQEFGINKLKEKGASQIHSKQYAMSHESDPDEIRDLANFLDSVIFENQSDGFSEKEDL